jgi:hypothetical protein
MERVVRIFDILDQKKLRLHIYFGDEGIVIVCHIRKMNLLLAQLNHMTSI